MSAANDLSNYLVDTKGCWIFQGSKMGQMGYAQLCDYYRGTRLGHRASYMMHIGEIPSGVDVGHICDTPACINPSHLILQTRSQNIQQAFTRGRGVSNWGRAAIKPGTEEFSSKVRKGVSNWWSNMTPDQRAEMGRRISEGKRKQS